MSDIHRTIEAMWKVQSTRLIAAIARVTREVGIAEELAQDALVAALERWPEEGIPEKPIRVSSIPVRRNVWPGASNASNWKKF